MISLIKRIVVAVIAIPLIILSLLLAVVPGSEGDEEHRGQRQIPDVSDSYIGMDYEDVYDIFRDAGFYYIERKDLKDVYSEEDESYGKVKKVSVNKTSKYNKGDWVDEDAKVIITVHSTIDYSEESWANRAIQKYNFTHPEKPVEPSMVSNWRAGGGNIATLVTLDGFEVEFNEVDGSSCFFFRSNNSISSENKKKFVDEAVKWFDAIFIMSENSLSIIHDNLSMNSSDICFDLSDSDVHYEEHYRIGKKEYNYYISIYPDWGYF